MPDYDVAQQQFHGHSWGNPVSEVGIYTGSESMISIPESFAGTVEKPITIRALDPGKVTLDGQDSNRPINTKGSYGVIQGVNAIRGDNENVMIRGHHWLIKDLMTWNVGSNGDTNIHLSGNDNTVEDCGSWGAARKSIAAGAAGGDRNTVRRCWARWEANGHMTSNPTNTFEGGLRAKWFYLREYYRYLEYHRSGDGTGRAGGAVLHQE